MSPPAGGVLCAGAPPAGVVYRLVSSRCAFPGPTYLSPIRATSCSASVPTPDPLCRTNTAVRLDCTVFYRRLRSAMPAQFRRQHDEAADMRTKHPDGRSIISHHRDVFLKADEAVPGLASSRYSVCFENSTEVNARKDGERTVPKVDRMLDALGEGQDQKLQTYPHTSAQHQHHANLFQSSHIPSHRSNPSSEVGLTSPASLGSVLTGSHSTSSLTSSDRGARYSASYSSLAPSEALPPFVPPQNQPSPLHSWQAHCVRADGTSSLRDCHLHRKSESSSSVCAQIGSGTGSKAMSHNRSTLDEADRFNRSYDHERSSDLAQSLGLIGDLRSGDETPANLSYHLQRRHGAQAAVRKPPSSESFLPLKTATANDTSLPKTRLSRRTRSSSDVLNLARTSLPSSEILPTRFGALTSWSSTKSYKSGAVLLQERNFHENKKPRIFFSSSHIIAPASLRRGDLEMLQALHIGPDDDDSKTNAAQRSNFSFHNILRRTSVDLSHGVSKAALVTKQKFALGMKWMQSSSEQRECSASSFIADTEAQEGRSSEKLDDADVGRLSSIFGKDRVQNPRRSSLPSEFSVAPNLRPHSQSADGPNAEASIDATISAVSPAASSTPRSMRSCSSSVLKSRLMAPTPPIPEESSVNMLPSRRFPSPLDRAPRRWSMNCSRDSLCAAASLETLSNDAAESIHAEHSAAELVDRSKSEQELAAISLESLTESDEGAASASPSPQALRRQAATRAAFDALEEWKTMPSRASTPGTVIDGSENTVMQPGSFGSEIDDSHTPMTAVDPPDASLPKAKIGSPCQHQRDKMTQSPSSSRTNIVSAASEYVRASSSTSIAASYRSFAKRSYTVLRQAFAGLPLTLEPPNNSRPPVPAGQYLSNSAVTRAYNANEGAGPSNGTNFGSGSGPSNSLAPGQGHSSRDGQRRPNQQAAGAGGGGGGGGGRWPGGAPLRAGANSTTESASVELLFKRLEPVGRGAYGTVYRGIHLATASVVALKVVNLDTPDDDVSDIQREVALLSQLREAEQKNVIHYWGCWLKGPELWIVMDFAEGGSVRTLMRAGPIAEQYAVVVVRETLVALAYLHKAGIIHRDIKAANILLTNQGRILLCDFGVAASLVSSAAKRTTFVGTPYWMAPEVITTGKSYDQSADIWSLGITIYEMVTGNPPLADQEQMRAILLIPKNRPPRLPSDRDFSQNMRDFVAICLNEEPRERLAAEELSKTKWIKSSTKTSTSILKELIAAYTSWTKVGGMRLSLLGAEAAELDANQRDAFAIDGLHDGDVGWEFSTLRNEETTSLTQLEVGHGHDPPAPTGPPRDHPLLRLFHPEGLPPPLDESEPRVPTSTFLNHLNSSNVRPAPQPPALRRSSIAEPATSDASLPGAEAPSWAPVNERPHSGEFSSQIPSSLLEPSASQPSTHDGAQLALHPQPLNTPILPEKPSFTGTGASPFRFGAPSENIGLPTARPHTPSAKVERQERRLEPGSLETAPPASVSPSKSPVRRKISEAESTLRRVKHQATEDAAPLSFSPGFGPLSSSPSEHHWHHSRQQSSTSAASSHSLGHHAPPSQALSSSLQSLIGADFTRPWMSASSRTRGSSHGSQPSEHSIADLTVTSATPTLSGSRGTGVLTTLGNPTPLGSASGTNFDGAPNSSAGSKSGWQPSQSSLLGLRGRSVSRSRAGPGGDMGTLPVAAHLPSMPALPRNGLTAASSAGTMVPGSFPALSAREHLARLQTTNGPFRAPDDSGELLPPSPSNVAAPASAPVLGASRARGGGSATRPSPLGFGNHGQQPQIPLHQRRHHGGSDPTVPSPKRIEFDNVLVAAGASSAAQMRSRSAGGFTSSAPPASSVALEALTRLGQGPLRDVSSSSAAASVNTLRPPDLSALRTKADVFTELDRTVDDLGMWLEALACSLTAPVKAASTSSTADGMPKRGDNGQRSDARDAASVSASTVTQAPAASGATLTSVTTTTPQYIAA